jgi:hypothetical protein
MPITLGELKRSIAKWGNSHDQCFILLIKDNPESKNKSAEYVYPGQLIVFDTVNFENVEAITEAIKGDK